MFPRDLLVEPFFPTQATEQPPAYHMEAPLFILQFAPVTAFALTCLFSSSVRSGGGLNAEKKLETLVRFFLPNVCFEFEMRVRGFRLRRLLPPEDVTKIWVDLLALVSCNSFRRIITDNARERPPETLFLSIVSSFSLRST